MKHLIRPLVPLLATCAILQLSAAKPAEGFVDFGTFAPPKDGGEFVEVQINNALISIAAQLAGKSDPQVADLLRDLHQIRVNVVGLNDENRAAMETRMQSLRADLTKRNWERIVTVQNKGEDVGVYLKTRGDEAVEGIVVTVLDGKSQAVFVNVVGNLRPEKIAALGEKFNLKPLQEIGQLIPAQPAPAAQPAQP